MHSSPKAFQEAMGDFLWSSWGGLGLRSLRRLHDGVAVDPEPLLVLSAWYFPLDLRLRDEVARWCKGHGSLLSAARLQAVMRADAGEGAHPLSTFAAALCALPGSPRWSFAEGGSRAPEDRLPPLRDADPIPYDRGAAAALRLRCLFGVGCRADVIAALLARPQVWVRAADLSALGYTKRACAEVLKDLAAAHWIAARQRGNAITYRLGQGPALAALVPQFEGIRWWPWSSLAQLLRRLSHFWDVAAAPPAVQLVELRSRMASVMTLVQGDLADLTLPALPAADAGVEALQSWALAVASWLADGGGQANT